MEKVEFNIRIATTKDIPTLNQLYQETVLHINRKDYSLEEVEDWASCADNMGQEHWDELFDEHYLIVAENNNHQIIGFASINDIGYLHVLFIHKDYQRKGIASILYDRIEKYALAKNIAIINSEVSTTAKGFFEKKGFKVNEEQMRKANKLYLKNYKMSKDLQ